MSLVQSIRVRASYRLTDHTDALVSINNVDYQIEIQTEIDTKDETWYIPVEFELRNAIHEVRHLDPVLGSLDADVPWIELSQVGWRPVDAPPSEPWLLMPVMPVRNLVSLYQTAFAQALKFKTGR